MRAGRLIAALLVTLSTLVPHDGHAAFGRTDGRFDVSADGAATYAIPIWLPEGPRGMTPSLALTYSSLSGNGPLGVGWSLSGLSAIERCRRVYPIDGETTQVTMTSLDGYCLGINRLRVISGSLGAANSTYGLEVDDYSVITASPTLQGNGPQSFTMLAKNGFTYEFGTTADSRVTFATNGTVLRWLLKKVSDRDGNSYQIDYAVSSGVEVPTSVSWSPTIPNGSSYRYSVAFTWVDKTNAKDWVAGYVAGNQFLSKKRLSQISVKQGSTTIRRYVLTYGTGSLTSFSRLTEIRECADDSNNDCLQPTTVAYQSGLALSNTSATVSISSGATIRGSADFNGDDKDDLVYSVGSNWYVLFGGNSGFGSPVLVSGLTGSFGTHVDYDNFLPGRRAAFVALIAGTVYTFSANNAGTAFTQASTGITISQGWVPTGIAASDSDLADLAWTISTTNIPPDNVQLAKNTTAPGATTPTFGTPFHGHTIPQLVTIDGVPMRVRSNSTQFISDRGLERRDFEGDGWPEFYGTLVADYCEPQNSLNCFWGEDYLVLFRTGGLDVDPPDQWVPYTIGTYPVSSPTRFNDDDCTDGGAVASNCSGADAPYTNLGPGFWIDWDGDGRSDFAKNNGSNYIAIQRSTGTGLASAISTTIPYADYRALDIDGDGLDDLARVDGATIRYYRRTSGATTYLTQYPDLLSSITDGFGNAYSVDYVSTAHSNHQPGVAVTGLIPPPKRIVVARATLPDGVGDTYTRSYTYVGGREDPLRGTFMGFQQRHETDSRTGLITKTYYRQTFPRTGWVWKTEVFRNGTTLLSSSVVTDAVETLSSTNFRQRYFPYVQQVTNETYEPEGAGSLIARQQTTFQNYDFPTGNVGTITTLVESGDGSDRWQSTTTLDYAPQTADCLDLIREVTVNLDRILPNQPVVTRKVRFTKDGSLCRHATRTVEPDNTRLAVTSTFEYDAFGNLSSVQVDALQPSSSNPSTYQAMPSRVSSTYWGSAGLAPQSITNAGNETTILDYYGTTGLLESITDTNGSMTSFEYDAFGRLTKITYPDQTSTSWVYQDCGSNCVSNTQHRMTIVQTERDSGGTEINRQYTYLDRFERSLVTRSPHANGGYQWRQVQYDVLGRIARSSVPCLTSQPTSGCVAGWTEFSQYDLLGRVKRIEQPANEGEMTRDLVTTIAYSGLASSVTDPFNRTSTTLMDVTGNLRRSTDANGYYQLFSYDSAGSLIQVSEQAQPGRNSVLFSAQYDYGIAAFQKSMTDRVLGTRTRWFDGFGQLRRWTDAKGQLFFADYDKLSRLTSQVSPDAARTFVWGNNPSAYNVGKLERQYSVSGGETYTENFLYDSLGRLSQQKITLPGETANPYIYDFEYHPTTGVLDTLTYPASTSGYRFALKYTVTAGFLRSIADANTPSTVYWALNPSADPTGGGGMNVVGQVTHDRLGPIIRQRLFDQVTGGLELITAGPSGNATALQNATVNYDDQGNAFQRQNNLGSLSADLTENFEYGEPGTDQIDRLTHIALTNGAGTQTRDLQYDDFGNLELLTAGSGATPFDLRPIDLSITWTSDNYPKTISAPWLTESAAFAYGPDQQRWRMVYQSGGASETTYYLGLMEKVVSGAGTEYRHYIPGPDEIIGIHSRAGAQSATRYLLSDHLGSLDAIVDSAGGNPQYAAFSALGVPRDPTDWDGAPSSTLEEFTRQGFTFQTVLGRMGLNHMNGRVHDAISGTFLSADPFIPDAMNTQAFNRYAYVYNNPLTLTDSSGFSPDEDTCGWFFCSGWPIIWPAFPDYDDLDDTTRDFIDCFRGGGCRGMWYFLRYNGPDVAPQTNVAAVDRKPVAVMAMPRGYAEASSTMAGARTSVYMMSVGYLGTPIFADVPVEEADDVQKRFMEMNLNTAEAAGSILSLGVGGEIFALRRAASSSGRVIIEAVAREEYAKGVVYLRQFLSRAEASLLNNARMRDLTIGKAVHRATWERLRREFAGRFDYFSTKGMDFVDKTTGELIELAKRTQRVFKQKKYDVGQDSVATYP